MKPNVNPTEKFDSGIGLEDLETKTEISNSSYV